MKKFNQNESTAARFNVWLRYDTCRRVAKQIRDQGVANEIITLDTIQSDAPLKACPCPHFPPKEWPLPRGALATWLTCLKCSCRTNYLPNAKVTARAACFLCFSLWSAAAFACPAHRDQVYSASRSFRFITYSPQYRARHERGAAAAGHQQVHCPSSYNRNPVFSRKNLTLYK